MLAQMVRSLANKGNNIKILVIGRLFPNNKMPQFGTFAIQEIRELAKLCHLKVIAPVPWFPRLPAKINKLNKWQIFSEVSKYEKIDNLDVFHPRYLVTPKIGRLFYFLFYLLGIFGLVRHIKRAFKFDLIIAFYGVPDGIASIILAKVLRKPIIVKLLGSDVNVDSKGTIMKRLYTRVLRKADLIVTVSEQLRLKTIKLGIACDKIVTVTNGVNERLFFPRDKTKQRDKLGLPLDKKIILFVGNMVPVKGVVYLIRAMKVVAEKYPDSLLILIGEGDSRDEYENVVRKLGLDSYVEFLGGKQHGEIPHWINASDVLCLPSLNEGYPNILLETIACGVPVVATNVGGVPEIVNSDRIGILVESADPVSLASALISILREAETDHRKESASNSRTWVDVAYEMYKLCERVVSKCNLNILL